MYLNLLQDAKIVKTFNGAAAGQTLQTSSTVAMLNFDSVMMIVDVGTVSAGAIMQLNALDGALSGGGDAAQMTNPAGANIQTASLTDSGGATSNKIFLLDVQRPLKSFVTSTFSRTTANVVVNSMWMIFYNSEQKPFGQSGVVTAATQDTSVAASAMFVAAT